VHIELSDLNDTRRGRKLEMDTLEFFVGVELISPGLEWSPTSSSPSVVALCLGSIKGFWSLRLLSGWVAAALSCS